MAPEHLSDELKSAGQAMVQQLDAIGLRPQGVLWLLFPHVNDWRLTVISDLVDVLGRSKVYGLIDAALERHNRVEGLTIFDVHLAASAEVVPRVLEGAFQVENGLVHLADCKIDGLPVDAVIYRLLPPREGAALTKAAKLFERSVKRSPVHP